MLYLNLNTDEMLEQREKILAKHKALAVEKEAILEKLQQKETDFIRSQIMERERLKAYLSFIGLDCEAVSNMYDEYLDKQIFINEYVASLERIIIHDETMAEYEGKEYLILTDSEADQRWNEYLDNFIDECILPEIPEGLQSYFDSEKLKNNAKLDGRGHSLAGYDWQEHEQSGFYLYRVV